MSLTTGTRLGPYEIAELIGAGGMGEVYRAHDTRPGREVAIKVLPEAFAEDADRLARFEREASSIAAFSHQNSLAIHDTGTHDGHRGAPMPKSLAVARLTVFSPGAPRSGVSCR